MGDTIASTPYVLEYVKKHRVEVYFNVNDPYIFLCENYILTKFKGLSINLYFNTSPRIYSIGFF